MGAVEKNVGGGKAGVGGHRVGGWHRDPTCPDIFSSANPHIICISYVWARLSLGASVYQFISVRVCLCINVPNAGLLSVCVPVESGGRWHRNFPHSYFHLLHRMLIHCYDCPGSI